MLILFLISIALGYLAGRLFVKAALNLSVLVTGFGMAYYADFLHEGKVYMIVVLAIIFSFLVWGLIYFFKGLLMGLKGKKLPYLWIPLFVVLLAFICIPPGYVFAELFYYITQNMEIPQREIIGWLVGIFFAYRAYKQFDLLFDYAPDKAFRFYKAGVDMVL